jgi:hypothetical protein
MTAAVASSKPKNEREHHGPFEVIKPGLNAGYDPSIHVLQLKHNLFPYLGERNIKTVCSLARLERETLRNILAQRDNPEEDLALIEQVLDDAGLSLGMTCEAITQFKEDQEE